MCEKIKEIKKLLDIVKVTDWSQIGDRVDEIKLMFDDLEKPKRKPVNGVLNLTGEEIEQLKEMQSIPKENTVTRVEIYCDGIVIKHHTPMMSWRMDEVRRLSTILWLAERFELIKED